MKQLINFNTPGTTSLFWGLTGGALLIVISTFVHKGLLQVSPYPLILILAFISFKPCTANKSRERFITGLATFMIMSVVLYVYLIVHNNPSALQMEPWEHLWRFAVILGVGAVSSLLLTVLVAKAR